MPGVGAIGHLNPRSPGGVENPVEGGDRTADKGIAHGVGLTQRANLNTGLAARCEGRGELQGSHRVIGKGGCGNEARPFEGVGHGRSLGTANVLVRDRGRSEILVEGGQKFRNPLAGRRRRSGKLRMQGQEIIRRDGTPIKREDAVEVPGRFVRRRKSRAGRP